MLHSVLIGLLVLGEAIAFSTTRAARLKRMARTLHLRYDKRVENPLTPLAAESVYLFNRTPHRFRQVLTWRGSGMFVRLCQMSTSASASANRGEYTLATAELMRGDFTPFILQPRTQQEAPIHPALPPGLAARFTLSAPDHLQLPPQVISLLETGPLCYLEASAYALVYHTFSSLPIAQLQPMRLRVQQLAKALMHVEPLPTPTVVSVPGSVELQAETLLKMHTPAVVNRSSSNGMKFVYLAVGLTFIIGVLWAAQYYLRDWGH